MLSHLARQQWTVATSKGIGRTAVLETHLLRITCQHFFGYIKPVYAFLQAEPLNSPFPAHLVPKLENGGSEEITRFS
jgi:hypothetical protein